MFLKVFFSTIVLIIPIISLIVFGVYISEYSSINLRSVYAIGFLSALTSTAYINLLFYFRKLFIKTLPKGK
jgi:hypothetical protein